MRGARREPAVAHVREDVHRDDAGERAEGVEAPGRRLVGHDDASAHGPASLAGGRGQPRRRDANRRAARAAKTTVMPAAQAIEYHRSAPGSCPL